MSSCKLVIKDQVNVKFENLSLDWRKKLHNKLNNIFRLDLKNLKY